MLIKADLSLRQVATAPPLGPIKQILDRPLIVSNQTPLTAFLSSLNSN